MSLTRPEVSLIKVLVDNIVEAAKKVETYETAAALTENPGAKKLWDDSSKESQRLYDTRYKSLVDYLEGLTK